MIGSFAAGRYDEDLLARARTYSSIPLAGALWSLRRAAGDWQAAIDLVRDQPVTLELADRGPLAVVDVARANAHDAHHHGWDIERSVTGRR